MSIVINQLLFGYKNGHRLLHGSIEIDKVASKILLILSDQNGTGSFPEDGYLTGFPLPTLNSYSISKTWPAYEMNRPGCVWTHTLLIRYADLAKISKVDLLSLFCRPNSIESWDEYGIAISTDKRKLKKAVKKASVTSMMKLISSVYEKPNSKVICSFNENDYIDELAITFWKQQWPRLQRKFKFCTWANTDYILEKNDFDLQFTTENILHRINSLSNKIDEDNRIYRMDLNKSDFIISKWIEYAATDACKGTNSSLKKFLFKYGAETDLGRAAYGFFVKFYISFYVDQPPSFLESIKLLKSFKPTISSLSELLIKDFINNSDEGHLPKEAVDFLISYILHDQIEHDQIDFTDFELQNLSKIILDSAPEMIWNMYFSNRQINVLIAKKAIKQFSLKEMLESPKIDESIVLAYLEANPEVAVSSELWDSKSPMPRVVFSILKNQGKIGEEIIYSILGSNNFDFDKDVLRHVGQAAINVAVISFEKGVNISHARNWIELAGWNSLLILKALTQCDIKDVRTLLFLSNQMSYRFNSNDESFDEWAFAVKNHELTKKSSYAMRTLAVYLMCRALSGSSRQPGVLIAFSFDAVHDSLLNSSLDYDNWRALERELPGVSLFSQWDKAYRLRMATAKFFVKNNISPENFFKISGHKSTFQKLLSDALSAVGGKDYVENFLNWMKNFERNKNNLDLIKNMTDREQQEE